MDRIARLGGQNFRLLFLSWDEHPRNIRVAKLAYFLGPLWAGDCLNEARCGCKLNLLSSSARLSTGGLGAYDKHSYKTSFSRGFQCARELKRS